MTSLPYGGLQNYCLVRWQQKVRFLDWSFSCVKQRQCGRKRHLRIYKYSKRINTLLITEVGNDQFHLYLYLLHLWYIGCASGFQPEEVGSSLTRCSIRS